MVKFVNMLVSVIAEPNLHKRTVPNIFNRQQNRIVVIAVILYNITNALVVHRLWCDLTILKVQNGKNQLASKQT